MVEAEDGGECLSVFGCRGVDRCLPTRRRDKSSLTCNSSVPLMASQLARILSRRASPSSPGNAPDALPICSRDTRVGAQKCVVQVYYASDESYHDRRWHRSMEGQGGPKVFRRGCSSRNCAHPIFCSFRVMSQILYQETDKATIDVEAPEDGILAKIIVSTHQGVREHISLPPEVTRRF